MSRPRHSARAICPPAVPLVVRMSVLLGAALPHAAARADAAAEAQFHDTLARQAFAARDFHRAIEEFLWAHRVAPNPRLLYNVALCFEQLGAHDDAYAYFAEYLSSPDDREGADARRAAAERALAALEAQVARLEVRTQPSGASVFVDDEDHGSYGSTPRVVALPEGIHRLTLVAPGYHPQTVEVRLVRGERVEVERSLVRIVGRLELRTDHPGPIELVDAEGLVVATVEAPSTVELPPGAYVVRGADATHQVVPTVATVRADGTSELLVPWVPRPLPSGEATVTCTSGAALVLLDGVEVGFTPTIVRDVREGPHRLRLELPGHDPWDGEVDVARDDRTWVTATLRAAGRRRRSPVGLSIGAIGVAGLAGALVTGPLALRTHRRFEALEADDPVAAADARARGRALNRTTDLLLGVGGSLFAAGVTLTWVLDDPHDVPSRADVSMGAP